MALWQVQKYLNFFDWIGDNTPGDIQYWYRSFANGIPILGDFYRAQDEYRYMDDYLHNRNLGWDDIKYPSRNLNSGLSGMTSFVSHNIARLYR